MYCRNTSEFIIGLTQQRLIQVNVKNSGDAAYLSVLDVEEFEGLYFVRTEKLSDVRIIFIFLAKVCFELFIRYGNNVQNNQ